MNGEGRDLGPEQEIGVKEKLKELRAKQEKLWQEYQTTTNEQQRKEIVERYLKVLRAEQDELLREYQTADDQRKKEITERYKEIDAIIEDLLFGETTK